jgi:fumarylacetoacetase
MNTHQPDLRSWVPIPEGSDFPLAHLPFGIIRRPGHSPHLAVAIGTFAADLKILADHGFFDDLDIDTTVFDQSVLNPFIALGKQKTRQVRYRLSQILDANLEEWDASELAPFFLFPQSELELLLPLHIGDYTDFYSSIEHATNVGKMFRDPDNALLPNWRHLPVGYHGRASSIVVSGTDIHRPKGQRMPPEADTPVFGPSMRMDFELEMAFVIGKSTSLGQSVSIADAEDYIFGMVLFNDWSARDIQQWEYVPLGPFLGKSFASTISPWVVPIEALEPFRVAGPVQEPAPLPYLCSSQAHNFDITLEVWIQPENGSPSRVCQSNFKHMYWNMAQQLAHHTSNGCNLNIGDLCASGTISGATPDSYGSMLELAWKGTKPITLDDGSTRTFLHDGDTVILKAWADNGSLRIGFGEARGKLLPAT